MTELTLDGYKKEVLKSKLPVVLWFSAYWCSACFLTKNDAEEFARENEKQIKFLKVDADTQEELAMRHEVKNLPAFVLVKNGEKIARLEGKQTKESLNKWLFEEINK